MFKAEEVGLTEQESEALFDVTELAIKEMVRTAMNMGRLVASEQNKVFDPTEMFTVVAGSLALSDDQDRKLMTLREFTNQSKIASTKLMCEVEYLTACRKIAVVHGSSDDRIAELDKVIAKAKGE